MTDDLSQINPEIIDDKQYFLLFETGKPDGIPQRSYLFTDPIDIIHIARYEDIPKAFNKIEKLSAKYYIAGYLSYELGYYFEEKFDSLPKPATPLIKMAVFPEVVEIDHKQYFSANNGSLFKKSNSGKYRSGEVTPGISRISYNDTLETIQRNINNGVIYQANFTFKSFFDFRGCAYSFYRDLVRSQPVPYSCFLKFGNEYILSLSPELFFRLNGDAIESRPMKGTIKRGKNNPDDEKQIEILRTSKKDLAENTMIVDLIRNDIGKLAVFGSVTVSELHSIEKYSSLFQMTSTVNGTLKEGISYFDIFKGLFPCGSVTGAPKITAMQLIRELEEYQRGVYCGAIGFISPDRKAVFNVPIRTIRIEDSNGEIGLGSGIVADSDSSSEYDECMLKAQFLNKKISSQFKIVETLLWDGQYFFLTEHLRRMRDSACYFDFPFSDESIFSKLQKKECDFDPNRKYRIRILLDEKGKSIILSKKIRFAQKVYEKAGISDILTDPDDVFLYHKTTNRKIYKNEYEKYRKKGFYDVIFFNKHGELTEGAISNIFIRENGRYFTPEISCGLLNGVYRDFFMSRNAVAETKINREMLESSDEVLLCNSVRGIQKVILSSR